MDLLPVISFAALVWQHHRPEGEDSAWWENLSVDPISAPGVSQRFPYIPFLMLTCIFENPEGAKL